MMRKVLDFVNQYQMIHKNDNVVAGVSGGADSVCLFFMLLKIREEIPFHLQVVHVNHGLREDAVYDAAYVEQLCRENQIPYHLVEVDIAKIAKQENLSEEEAGRRARYQAFNSILQKMGNQAGKIAVAHHQNDRAETVLFHLFRGSGLTGLTGIRPVNGQIIRPLLCLTREEIENWLEENHISYCEDQTNAEDHYTRNRIRHHILPYAEEQICHGVVRHVNQAAENLEEAEAYLCRETEKAVKKCCILDKDKAILDLGTFSMLDEYIQGRVLLSCIEEAFGGRKDITSVHIHSIKQLFLKEGNGEISLPSGIYVLKSYQQGTMIRGKESSVKREVKEIKENASFYAEGLGNVETAVFPCTERENFPRKAYTKWFDYDKISTSVLLRTRETGDYLSINSRMDKKSIQDYFINEKIPKQERDTIYLFADGSHIMWIPGYRMSEFYKVTEHTKQILQIQINKEEGKEDG